jgi:hypothetical protein
MLRHQLQEIDMATAKKAPAKKHSPAGAKQDRAKVATKQPYEVDYEAKKMKVAPAAVKAAAKKVGPMRRAIEAVLTALTPAPKVGPAKKAAVKNAAAKKRS